MTNETESAGVEVTQADREAAAQQYERSPYEISRCQGQVARQGHFDGAQLVQAFARHRTTAEAGKRELVEALEMILKCTPMIRDGAIINDCGDPFELARATLAKHGNGV